MLDVILMVTTKNIAMDHIQKISEGNLYISLQKNQTQKTIMQEMKDKTAGRHTENKYQNHRNPYLSITLNEND